MITWEYIYSLLGITDFIHFIDSPAIQDALFPIKLVFVLFTAFFFAAVMYFYINSSYIQYHFLQDTVEFLSWQPYGLRQINKRWQKIMKKVEGGSEDEYKLAIMEADEFLYKTLEDKGFDGETFEELLKSASSKIVPSYETILSAHGVRNSIVHDSDYKLNLESAKTILSNYEKAIKGV